MPHLEFQTLEVDQIKLLSKKLPPKLSKVVGCPCDWFTFALSSQSRLYYDGEVLTDTVFVHVEWFDRGQKVKDEVAKIITEEILCGTKLFVNAKNVTVIFKNLDGCDYFENNVHF